MNKTAKFALLEAAFLAGTAGVLHAQTQDRPSLQGLAANPSFQRATLKSLTAAELILGTGVVGFVGLVGVGLGIEMRKKHEPHVL